jgi:hypothetical protein
MTETPPHLLYVVVDMDRIEPDDDPLVHVHSYPFATREEAEQEKQRILDADDHYEQEEGERPYAEHHVSVHEIKLPDRRLKQADRQDAESHRLLQEAAGAVGASLLADEGIGPLSDGGNTDAE